MGVPANFMVCFQSVVYTSTGPFPLFTPLEVVIRTTPQKCTNIYPSHHQAHRESHLHSRLYPMAMWRSGANSGFYTIYNPDVRDGIKGTCRGDSTMKIQYKMPLWQ